LEGIIPLLKHRGYKVAAVKHSAHGFDIDRPGKDSKRYAQAGADKVMISSTDKWALISQVDKEFTLEEIRQFIKGVDIILTEGYSKDKAPKIEVLAEDALNPIFEGQNLIALVGKPQTDYGVPCFRRDDFAGVVNFIEQGFLTQTSSGKAVDLGKLPVNIT
jgi:molybdopterin-guanine dinucleotide biosynthesis protein MobB